MMAGDKAAGVANEAVAGLAVLGDLLLELAGKSAGRMLSAKRHVGILEAAFPFLDNGQRTVARGRIAALEERWGRLSSCPALAAKTGEIAPAPSQISPELRVARWLSKRRHCSHHLRVLHRAAVYFAGGGTGLCDAQAHAYARELDGVLSDVGLSSFTEWMIELRIAKQVDRRIYGPGDLCEWWAKAMIPTNGEDTPQGICTALATELCRRRLPRHR